MNINNEIEYLTQENKTNTKKKILLISIIVIVILGIILIIPKKHNNTKINNNLSYTGSIFDPNRPILIHENYKYGFITSTGKVLIEPKYNYAEEFYGNYAIVLTRDQTTNEELYQLIDTKGNVKLSSIEEIEYINNCNGWLVGNTFYDFNLNKKFGENLSVDYIDYDYLEYRDYDKDESGIIKCSGKKYLLYLKLLLV